MNVIIVRVVITLTTANAQRLRQLWVIVYIMKVRFYAKNVKILIILLNRKSVKKYKILKNVDFIIVYSVSNVLNSIINKKYFLYNNYRMYIILYSI